MAYSENPSPEFSSRRALSRLGLELDTVTSQVELESQTPPDVEVPMKSQATNDLDSAPVLRRGGHLRDRVVTSGGDLLLRAREFAREFEGIVVAWCSLAWCRSRFVLSPVAFAAPKSLAA